MPLITKPDFTYVWASGGAVVAPNDTKKQQGWVAEAPPFQYDNWLQNRQDQMLAHINQRGIPQWDGLTEYEAASLSYVQGTNGVVYKSVAASGPSTTVQDPTTDVTDTYWAVAFASTAQATETVQGIVELATTAEAEAGLDDVRAMTPLKVKQAIDQFASSSLPFGYFSGFTLSNNSGAPNTTIDISSGAARNSTNAVDIISSSITSGILPASGSWTAGNNQNKLDTGARANNSTYHVFKIYKTVDGSSEDLFSLSPTAPTMPSGYAGFRRVGRIVTDASGNIRQFKARGGGWFDWVTPISEIVVVGVVPSARVMPVTGMGGVPTQVRFNALVVADGANVRISAVDVDNPATGADWTTYTGGQTITVGSPSVSEGVGGEQFSEVGTAGTVNLLLYASSGNIFGAKVMSMGYKEYL